MEAYDKAKSGAGFIGKKGGIGKKENSWRFNMGVTLLVTSYGDLCQPLSFIQSTIETAYLCTVLAAVGLLLIASCLTVSSRPLVEKTCTFLFIFLNDMKNSQIILAEVFLKEKLSLKERPIRENFSPNVQILMEL